MSDTKVVQDKKYDYKVIKAKGTKKGTILFIHGYCVDYSYFVCANRFPEYDLWMVNLPGHGNNTVSAETKVYKEQLKFANIVKYVVDFIEDMKLDDIYLIGHSMGGAVAALVQQQIKSKVKKIVLVSPMNFASIYRAFTFLTKFFPKNIEEKMMLQTYLYYNVTKYTSDDNWNKMIKNQLQFQLDNWKQMEYLGKKQMGSLSVLMKVRKAQKNINIPFLLCLGVADKIIPYNHTKKLFLKQHGKQKTFKLETFQTSAHLCFEEETDKFVQVVKDFLEAK